MRHARDRLHPSAIDLPLFRLRHHSALEIFRSRAVGESASFGGDRQQRVGRRMSTSTLRRLAALSPYPMLTRPLP
jgi:hypothetical protein